MEGLIDCFLPVSIWFQSIPGWLSSVFKGITFLGNTEFYLIVMPALYWCIDATLGIRIGILLLVSGGVNNLLKFTFQWPRPFWVTSQVDGMVEATGFGFPSGHSQNAAALWGLVACSVRKTWLRWVAYLLIFLIGLSRIALGVHFTHDVLMGWLVGGLLLGLFLFLEKGVVGWFKRSSFPAQLAVLAVAASLFILPAVLLVHPFSPPALPQQWIDGAGELINPYHFEDVLTTSGSFFGLGLGILLLHQAGGYTAAGETWKRVLRYLLGLVGVLALYLGLGSLFPDEVDLTSYALRFLRYSLIGLWISYGAPMVFRWSKLSDPA